MSDREAFERFISSPPFEKSIDRYPNNPELYAWSGNYKDINVSLAWECWQEAEKRVAELKFELKRTESRLNEVSAYCAELLHMIDAEHRKAPEAE